MRSTPHTRAEAHLDAFFGSGLYSISGSMTGLVPTDASDVTVMGDRSDAVRCGGTLGSMVAEGEMGTAGESIRMGSFFFRFFFRSVKGNGTATLGI